MRLTKAQKNSILEQVKRHFGPETRVWLFGSRVNDQKRGGDFDFYLETALADAEAIFQKRLDLLKALHETSAFADEKIDLVIHSPLSGTRSVIAKHALQQGIQLI